MKVSRTIAGCPTRIIAAMNTAVIATVLAAPAVRACTTLTTNASRHHAVTSSIAAQASAIAPIGVLWMPRSVRMRARTGKAVTDIETPRKSEKLVNETLLDES